MAAETTTVAEQAKLRRWRRLQEKGAVAPAAASEGGRRLGRLPAKGPSGRPRANRPKGLLIDLLCFQGGDLQDYNARQQAIGLKRHKTSD